MTVVLSLVHPNSLQYCCLINQATTCRRYDRRSIKPPVNLIKCTYRLANELVCEDASHLCMEMGHLWYKSYSLHSIGLRGGTSQHGRSDQICSYSETVGPDWSGHAHLQVRTCPPSTYARCEMDENPSPRTGWSIDHVNGASPICSVCTVKQYNRMGVAARTSFRNNTDREFPKGTLL